MVRIAPVDLKNKSFFETKQLAKSICAKTIEDISEETGLGYEHIARHFRDPKYNIGTPNIPSLCRAMGNDLQIEWQCVQVGGLFVRVDRANPDDTNMASQMSRVSSEAAHAVGTMLDALKDGSLTSTERHQIAKELRDLIRVSEEALLVAENKNTTGIK